jgi:3',5'-cyclic AMP phosphodiesterase CpdA
MSERTQDQINLLHLSDIHFRRGESGDVYDLDSDLRNEVERDATRMRVDRIDRVQGILVTGDIAFAGKKEEYDTAREWLERLCDLLGCARENVWLVPGNHDVDRDVINHSETLRTYHEKLRNTTDIDGQMRAYMRDVIAQRVLFEPIAQYNTFAARFQCNLDADNPFWQQDLILNDGSVLSLRGLNTTLISWWNDNTAENKLILGSVQSKPKTLDGVTYRTLCHHPPQWLRDEDQVSQNLNTRVHVQLFGHKHKQKVEFINNTVRITAGAIHPNRREPEWQPRYNFISLSVSGAGNDRLLNVTVYPRVWSDEEGVFKGDYDASGSDVRRRTLTLNKWYPSVQNLGVAESGSRGSTFESSLHIERDTIEVRNDVTQESRLMNKARRLAYRFYSLPYDARIEVVQGLHLIREDDEGLQGSELFNRLLRRAKEENMLSRLWDEVQKAHGDGLDTDNPFHEGAG